MFLNQGSLGDTGRICMLKCSHLPLAKTLKAVLLTYKWMFYFPRQQCYQVVVRGTQDSRAQNREVGPLAEPRGLRNGPAVPGINSLYNSFPSLKLANYNNQLVSDLGFRDLSGYSGFVCC